MKMIRHGIACVALGVVALVLSGCPAECSEGLVETDAGACVEADAGLADAGQEDAGRLDAGPTDAGMDGGDPDSGGPEDGGVDAGCTPDSCPAETPVCVGGRCVECTADDRSACDVGPDGPNLCDPETLRCTRTPAGSGDACEPCFADAQCAAGMLCVPSDLAGDFPGFCLWREDAPAPGPAGTCALNNARPFRRQLAEITSVDGTEANVCTLEVSNCVALLDYRTTPCPGPGPVGDAMCGVPDLVDSLCVTFHAGEPRCTLICESSGDCPPSVPCRASDNRCVWPADG